MDETMQPPEPSVLAPTSDAGITNGEIAAVSKEILESTSEPILLANLGSRLSKHYGRALREILASRKLKRILETELGGKIEFTGELSKVSVNLLSDADKLNSGTYHPTIWAAFFKPVAADNIGRAIKSSRRFDFKDISDQSDVPPGWHFIKADLIPDGELAKADREATAKMNIHDWCVQENIDRDSLLAKAGRKAVDGEAPSQRQPSKEKVGHEGTASLMALIEAVPEDRRKSYSLTLDLIYQLIS